MLVGQLVAHGAHKFPVSSFPAEAVQLIGLTFARSGLTNLVLTLLCVLVLIRYRAMIPLTYVLLLIQHTGVAIVQLKEAAITGVSSATAVSLVLLFFTAVGLFLSLYGSSASSAECTEDLSTVESSDAK